MKIRETRLVPFMVSHIQTILTDLNNRKQEVYPEPMSDQLLRGGEVASRLGVSLATAYRWMRAGVLPVVRFSGARTIRVSQSALDRWIERNTTGKRPRADEAANGERSPDRSIDRFAVESRENQP